MPQGIHQSAEDYLETILMLKERIGNVRSIDIVNELNFTKPSVSVAMKKLRLMGLITMDKAGLISLTPEGRGIADAIYTRHKALTKLFVAMGVSEKAAEQDACRMEHVISEETFCKLMEYARKTFPQLEIEESVLCGPFRPSRRE